MSSTERAPEPTMEEILASIRRIISDDDSNSTRRGATPASVQEAARLDAADAEADTRIIDDIARVLSGGAPGSTGDDDILDLTKELGPVDAAMEEEPLEAATGLDFAAVFPRPDPYADAPAAPNTFASDNFASGAYASDAYASSAGAEAGTEPMSALDAAIAALRAGMGQVSQPESEPVLTDLEIETIVQEPVAEISEPAEERSSWTPASSSWARNGETPSEPAPPRVNGGSHEAYYAEVDFSGQSLQDSVKASLRPLLRQWLDAHMSRVLEAALRDELKDADENMSRLLTAALRDELKDAEVRRRSS